MSLCLYHIDYQIRVITTGYMLPFRCANLTRYVDMHRIWCHATLPIGDDTILKSEECHMLTFCHKGPCRMWTCPSPWLCQELSIFLKASDSLTVDQWFQVEEEHKARPFIGVRFTRLLSQQGCSLPLAYFVFLRTSARTSRWNITAAEFQVIVWKCILQSRDICPKYQLALQRF